MKYLLFFHDNNGSTKADYCHVIPILTILVSNMAVPIPFSLFNKRYKNWTCDVLHGYRDVKC